MRGKPKIKIGRRTYGHGKYIHADINEREPKDGDLDVFRVWKARVVVLYSHVLIEATNNHVFRNE